MTRSTRILAIVALALAVPAAARAALVDINAGLTGVKQSAAAWGDFDNDGDLDLALLGEANVGGLIARIYRNDAGTFTNIGAPLTLMIQPSLSWCDFDNDGDLDLFACGGTASFGPITRLYRNDGGTFTNLGNSGLPDVLGSAAWSDYDLDGDLDVAIVGFDGSGPIARVYRNDGGTFTDTGAGLPGVEYGVAWILADADPSPDLVLLGDSTTGALTRIYHNDGDGFTDMNAGLMQLGSPGDLSVADYDADGDDDLLVSGYDYVGSAFHMILYRNTNGAFAEDPVGLPLTLDPGVWGDVDNDGDLDLLLTGTAATTASIVFRNDGGTFTDMGAGLPYTGGGRCAWGDLDGDLDLDLILTGNSATGAYAHIFRNTTATANTPPSAPTNLDVSERCGNTYLLTFTPATDAQTPAAALTYNLRIGTTPGGSEVTACMANATNGYRRIAAPGQGDASYGLYFFLPPGIYYWSVQAIDNSFVASPWATERVFRGFPVDGTREVHYGPSLVTQAVKTSFGDNLLGAVDHADGSELDEAYGLITGLQGSSGLIKCKLQLMLTGNLRSDFTKLELFFDTGPGGQQRLRGDNAPVGFGGLNRMGDDGSGNGLTFDAAFTPDYWIGLTGGDVDGEYRFFGNWAELPAGGGGDGKFLGQTTAASEGLFTDGDNPFNIRATINNANVVGVTGGSTAQSGAGAITGIELQVPQSALGSPDGCIKVCAFINAIDHDDVSNQVLGSLVPPHTSLGDPRFVDFSRETGEQWFTVCPSAPVGVEPEVAVTVRHRLVAVGPNPSAGVAFVRFDLPEPGRVALEIFNAAGRRVRLLATGDYPSGPHQAWWTGQDDGGRALPGGLYFVRLSGGGDTEVRKLVLRR